MTSETAVIIDLCPEAASHRKPLERLGVSQSLRIHSIIYRSSDQSAVRKNDRRSIHISVGLSACLTHASDIVEGDLRLERQTFCQDVELLPETEVSKQCSVHIPDMSLVRKQGHRVEFSVNRTSSVYSLPRPDRECSRRCRIYHVDDVVPAIHRSVEFLKLRGKSCLQQRSLGYLHINICTYGKSGICRFRAVARIGHILLEHGSVSVIIHRSIIAETVSATVEGKSEAVGMAHIIHYLFPPVHIRILIWQRTVSERIKFRLRVPWSKAVAGKSRIDR